MNPEIMELASPAAPLPSYGIPVAAFYLAEPARTC